MVAKVLPIEDIVTHEGSNTPRVAGTGITVAFLSRFVDDPNWSVERICAKYALTPSQVYAAWSYYYSHKEEVDRAIAEAEEKVRQTGVPIIIPD